MKIAVIGYPGSGKRALTEYLKNKFYCATLYLDDIDFPNESAERSLELKKEMVEAFKRENISWVIDGDGFDIDFEKRMEEADKIVIMKYNRFSCLIRKLDEYSNQKKKLDRKTVDWVLFKSRSSERRKIYNLVMRKYYDKVVMFFNNMQLLMYRDLI